VFVYVNNSDEARAVPWARYTEIAEGLTEGCDAITGQSVNMENLKVAPMTSIVVEFTR
jgi:hypothetical protein